MSDDQKALNIVSYYGKVQHDLRKLKQQDKERIKLIESVINRINESEYFDSNEKKCIFDLPILESKYSNDAINSTKINTRSTIDTNNNDFNSSLDDNIDSLDSQLKSLIADISQDITSYEPMSTFLESQVMLSFSSNNITSNDFMQFNKAISDEYYLEFNREQDNNEMKDSFQHQSATSSSNLQKNNQNDFMLNFLSESINNPNNQHRKELFHDLQSQLDVDYIAMPYGNESQTVNRDNIDNNSTNTRTSTNLSYEEKLAKLRKEHEVVLKKAIYACQPFCPFHVKLN